MTTNPSVVSVNQEHQAAAQTAVGIGGGTSAGRHVGSYPAFGSPPSGDQFRQGDWANGLDGSTATFDGTTWQVSQKNSGTPPATLTTQAGNLTGGNVTLATAATTLVMSTASLAIGTWVVSFVLSIQANSHKAELGATVGSGTATFTGQTSTEYDLTHGSMTLTFIATVTVAAVLNFSVTMDNAGSGTALQTTDGTGALSNATGYTAIKTA